MSSTSAVSEHVENSSAEPSERSLRVMQALIPFRPSDWTKVGESAKALALVDSWLALDLVALLRQGVPGEHSSVTGARDYPLAELITSLAPDARAGAHQQLRAALVVGVALQVKETALLVRVADGARKASTHLAWGNLVPPLLPLQPGLRELLQHISAHAELLQRTDPALSNPQREWLVDLKRWCELVTESVGRSRPKQVSPPCPSLPPTSGSAEADEAKRPTASLLDAEEGEDEDSRADDEDGEESEVGDLVDGNPEAQDSQPVAEPDHPNDGESSQAGEARRARTGFFTARENQHLIWDNPRLSPIDVAALVTALDTVLRNQRSSQRHAAGLLALVMCTGSLAEQVAQISRTPQTATSWLDGRYFCRRVPAQRSAWKAPPSLVNRLAERSTHVRLGLPTPLADWLGEVLPAGEAKTLAEVLGLDELRVVSVVRDFLTKLREDLEGGQTLSRVETWLPLALAQGNEHRSPDHVPSHLLCGVMNGQRCPAAYYRAYPADRLAEHHQEVLLNAGWRFDDSPLPAQTGFVGTELNPKPGQLRADLDAVRDWSASVTANKALPLYLRHNAREAADVLALALQHGLRAVSDPFESLALVDTVRRRMLIDDKFQSDARSHRLIPLSTFGCAAVDAHIEHVRRLIPALMDVAPETAQRLRCMLEKPAWRAAPFRFFLDERMKIVPITRKQLEKVLGDRWPWPMNVGRHAGSIALLANGVDDQALQSFYGHAMLGTQSRSTWSPLSDNKLYERLIPALDEWAAALDLQPITSFLEELAAQPAMPQLLPRPVAMDFGHERRARQRAARQLRLKSEVEAWVKEALKERHPCKLVQADVDALFERVRRATANATSSVASSRFELMRSVFVDLITRHDLQDLELPAVGLSIRDHAHVCSMDSLSAASWLDSFDKALHTHWGLKRSEWKRSAVPVDAVDVNALVISLCATSLILDPELWRVWLKTPASFLRSQDPEGRYWLHLKTASENLRQYAVPPAMAALIHRVPSSDWASVTEATLGNSLKGICQAAGLKPPQSFWHFLSRMQSAVAVICPGLVLGQADGSHKSVSPAWTFVERLGGATLRLATLAAIEAEKAEKADLEDAALGSTDRVAFDSGSSDLSLLKEYRIAMRNALSTLTHGAKAAPSSDKRPGDKGDALDQVVSGEPITAKPTSDAGRRVSSPRDRFTAALHELELGLVANPRLPAICRLTFGWVQHLAHSEHMAGKRYATKTIRNYWFSWGLRLIEEVPDFDPRLMLPSELEELYSSIVEDAVLHDKTHLYAPARNFHRWLMLSEGVAEIDWSEFRALAGVDHRYVNANLIQLSEYETALDLLLEDQWVDKRRRTMQAAVLILLYRFGLRFGEALGLQRGDLGFSHALGIWWVRVRGNAYRALKTSAARRTVPGLEPLTAKEEGTLRQWLSHVGEERDALPRTPLFALSPSGSEALAMVPKQSVARRLAEAIRGATSDPTVRVHHCRHSFATRLLAEVVLTADWMSSSEGELQARLAGLAELSGASLEGAGDREFALRRSLSSRLVNERDASRRAIWAVAALLGHAWPATTLNVYAHAGHQWLRAWCQHTRWSYWTSQDDDFLAWCGGRVIKSLQRQRQRVFASGQALSARDFSSLVAPDWTIQGERVRRASALSSLRIVPDRNWLTSGLRILRFAVRMQDKRALGAADVLIEDEDWVREVVSAMHSWSQSLIASNRARAGGLWVDLQMERHLIGADHLVDALSKLEAWSEDQLTRLEGVLERHLHVEARMLLCSDITAMKQVSDLLSKWLGADQLEILVPAESTSVQPILELDVKPKSEKPRSAARPRREYRRPHQSLSELHDEARNLGLKVRLHGRMPVETSDWHIPGRATQRLGLRPRRDKDAEVGSATSMVTLGLILLSALSARRKLNGRTPSVKQPTL